MMFYGIAANWHRGLSFITRYSNCHWAGGCFWGNAGFLYYQNYQNAEADTEKQMRNIYSVHLGSGWFQIADYI
jgi:hypothetical protein